MAAAGSGVFRPSRGLLILSLLCLLGFADSAIQMDMLEILMEQLRNIKQSAEPVMEDGFYTEILTVLQPCLNSMLTIFQRAPPEMKPMQPLLQVAKYYVDRAVDEMSLANDKIEDMEEKLKKLKEMLKGSGENHDEF